jgi:NAD(P)H dehydrogenase (quinone)
MKLAIPTRIRRTRRRKILVVHCHPIPVSFMAAALHRTVLGATNAGHELRITDLYADNFDPRFSAEEHVTHGEPGTHPSVAHHAEDLQWCDTLILVYPTWWSSQPAMLKGWIDRVWARSVAWEHRAGTNRLQPGLGNVRRIIVVTAHGSSKLVNALEGEAGKRTVSRGLRVLCHRYCRTSWWAIYGLDTASPQRRNAFLDTVERRATAL